MTKIDIFSGFLGAGKTTLIKKLISEAYSGQKLVLIENEFGEIGIDGGFLQDAGINITEMNSGCICCSLVGDFGKALTQVISEYAPDRVIIEPSGVGKLSDVIAAVNKVTDDQVTLGFTVAVVDAGKVKVYMKNFGEFYNNQVETASTIILSRTDSISQQKLDTAIAMLREHNDHATIITTPWDDLTGEQIWNAMEGKASLAADLAQLVHDHHHEHEHCCCGHDHDHEHHHHHEHGEECCCGHDHDHEHHHHHEHGEECCCGHDHDHEHHHHHEHEHCCCGHEHDHEHHHNDEHGEECCCGHDHDHEHHHHHEHGEECCCGHDHDHEHHHHHEHGEECCCGHDHDHEHHHHHEHGEECCCGHDHDHEHHHHHEHGEECCCGHDHDHEHHHHHEHGEECCCGHDHDHEHHHHHEHGEECCCGHDHDHEHHHHHEHGEECCCGHDHDHEHHHHHEHGEECCCGHDHGHEHHHHHEHDEHCSCGHDHHADEVFTSWGVETAKHFTVASITAALQKLDTREFGFVLRAKGIVPGEDGKWIHFDYVPGENNVRLGSAAVTGKICVIGADLDEADIADLFGV